jgi:peroxiredoxin Q/BCP
VAEDLTALGAVIVGVSPDDAATQMRFINRLGLPYRLLPDPDRAIIRPYGARRWLGLSTKRITYVIGQDGRIAAGWHGEVRMERHAGNALAAVRALVDGQLAPPLHTPGV